MTRDSGARSFPTLAVLDEYRTWLIEERSLAPLTVRNYLKTASWFLEESGMGNGRPVAVLTAGDVSRFVLDASRTRSPRTVNEIVVGLRSLLRFLYARGLIATPLAQATPWMAGARTASLPRSVPPGTPDCLLASCDRSTLAGVHYAILKVLVRLGLRGAEVAALELDDIDWRGGQIVISSKGGRRDPLPLPVDVGEAITDYLRIRGSSAPRAVFLQVQARGGPITTTAVRAVVRRSCTRCGLSDTGTHRLRHGAATDMLRAGAPLYEIGQVLRHRDLETTAIYAKVDLPTLATVVKAWPGAPR
jgi:site-specific recombinase XerC